MKKFLKNSNSGIISLIEIIVGVLLLINHNAVISYFMIIAGAILAVSGVVSLIKYFIAKPDEAKRGSLTGALVSLSIGIFLIICNSFIHELVHYVTLIIGAAILYIGYQKLENAVEKIRKKQFFLVSLVSALITIVIAALVIFKVVEAIVWIFIGVALIVEAAIDLADMIVGAVKSKKDEKNDNVIEAAAEENKAPSEE